MFFKNLKSYRLKSWELTAESLNEALEKFVYVEGSASSETSLGWVPPCSHASHNLVHAIEGQYLIMLRSDKKLLPSSVVNKYAKAKAAKIETEQGYKPGKKQMKEIKEQVITDLLPKAFTVSHDILVWIDSRNNWFVIDAASTNKADEVLGLFAKAVEPFPVVPLYVEQSPSSAMTQWLVDQDAPEEFSVDQETEMRSASESGATVKYVRQSVEQTDAQRHVEEGKQVTRLAMTWGDRISFVLTDSLDIKKVAPLDVLKTDSHANEADSYDGAFTLMTGELAGLLGAIVAALGGERADA